MKLDKNLIYEFRSDILSFMRKQKENDFKLNSYYNEDIQVYFFLHNNKNLRENETLISYVHDKMNSYFFSKRIYNVSFTDDFIVTDWNEIDSVEEIFNNKKINTGILKTIDELKTILQPVYNVSSDKVISCPKLREGISIENDILTDKKPFRQQAAVALSDFKFKEIDALFYNDNSRKESLVRKAG